jgi:hypothetical protein
VEGHNIAIKFRNAEGSAERLRAFVVVKEKRTLS